MVQDFLKESLLGRIESFLQEVWKFLTRPTEFKYLPKLTELRSDQKSEPKFETQSHPSQCDIEMYFYIENYLK
jgi:hypothetical protein